MILKTFIDILDSNSYKNEVCTTRKTYGKY